MMHSSTRGRVKKKKELGGATGVATGGQTTDRAGAPEVQNKYRKRHGSRRLSAEAECRRCRTHNGGAFLRVPLVGGGPSRFHFSAHPLCVAVADATLRPELFRPEMPLSAGRAGFTPRPATAPLSGHPTTNYYYFFCTQKKKYTKISFPCSEQHGASGRGRSRRRAHVPWLPDVLTSAVWPGGREDGRPCFVWGITAAGRVHCSVCKTAGRALRRVHSSIATHGAVLARTNPPLCGGQSVPLATRVLAI